MTTAYINRIATAVPPHDIHDAFLAFAESQLSEDPRKTSLFRRMSDRSGIDHRYSCFAPAAGRTMRPSMRRVFIHAPVSGYVDAHARFRAVRAAACGRMRSKSSASAKIAATLPIW